MDARVHWNNRLRPLGEQGIFVAVGKPEVASGAVRRGSEGPLTSRPLGPARLPFVGACNATSQVPKLSGSSNIAKAF